MRTVIEAINEVCFNYKLSLNVQNTRQNMAVSNPPPPPEAAYNVVSASALKNSRRKMEDRHIVIHDLNTIFTKQDATPSHYYAVFDGHDGEDAAAYSVNHLHQYLAESTNFTTEPEQAIRDAFCRTDSMFLNKCESENIVGGTTAVCALLLPKEKTLYIAWTGDSQAALVSQGKIMQCVRPHKPDREDERIRIEKEGGIVIHWGVWRVNGQLGVSRAIGDSQYKPYITAVPEIVKISLGPDDDFFVLGSDGLWDHVPETDIAKVVYDAVYTNPDKADIVSRDLVQLAKCNGSSDNISVIVVFLRDPRNIAAGPRWTNVVVAMDALDNANNPFVLPSKANGEGPKEHAEDGLLLNINDGFELLKKKDDMPNNDLIKMLEKSNCARLTPEFDKDDNLGPETDVDNPDDGSASPNLDAMSRRSEVINNNQHFNPFNDIEKSLELNLNLKEGTFEGLTTPTDETCPPPSNAAHNVSQLIDAVAESDSEEEEEWNYVSGEEANKENVVPLQLNSKVAEEEEEDDTEETMSQLNPNAAEFVPVSPTRAVASPLGRLMCDEVLSQSPKRPPAQDELDLNVPSPVDFDKDISQRPHDTEETISNGHQNEADIDVNEPSNNLTSKPDEFHFGPNAAPFTPSKLLDQSEASSTRAVYGDDSVITLGTSFNDSQFGQDDLDRVNLTAKDDPMSVSFHQDREDDSNPFDLNKVHVLPDDEDDERDDESVEKCNLSNSLLNETISDLAEHFPLRKPEEQDKPPIEFSVTDLDHEDNKNLCGNRVTSPTESDRTQSPLEDRLLNESISDLAEQIPLRKPTEQDKSPTEFPVTDLDHEDNKNLFENRVTSPVKSDRTQSPLEDSRTESPSEHDRVSIPFEEDRAVSPIQEQKISSPFDDRDLSSNTIFYSPTVGVEDYPEDERELRFPMQEKESTLAIGEEKVWSELREKEVVFLEVERELYSPVQDKEVSSAFEETEFTNILAGNNEKTIVEEKEVNSLFEEEKEKSTIEEKEVSSPLEDKEKCAIEEKEVSSPLEDKEEVLSVEERNVISPVEERDVISPADEVSVTSLLHEKELNFPIGEKSEVFSLNQHSEISPVEQSTEFCPVEQKTENLPVEQRSELFSVEHKSEIFPMEELEKIYQLEEKGLSCSSEEQQLSYTSKEGAADPLFEERGIDQTAQKPLIEENEVESPQENEVLCLEEEKRTLSMANQIISAVKIEEEITSSAFEDRKSVEHGFAPLDVSTTTCDNLNKPHTVTSDPSLDIGGFAESRTQDIGVEMVKEDLDDMLSLGVVNTVTSMEAATNSELADTHSTSNLLGESLLDDVSAVKTTEPKTSEAEGKEDVTPSHPPNDLLLSPTSSDRDDPMHSHPTPECDQLLADSRGPLDVSGTSLVDTESVATTEVNSFLGRSLLEVESPLSPNLSRVLQAEDAVLTAPVDACPIIDLTASSPEREAVQEFSNLTSTPVTGRPLSLSPSLVSQTALTVTKSPAEKSTKLTPKDAEKKATKGKTTPSMAAAKKSPAPRNSLGTTKPPAASPRPAPSKSAKQIPPKTDLGAASKVPPKTTAAPKPTTARVPLASRTLTKPAATNGDTKAIPKMNTGTIKKITEGSGSARSTTSTAGSRTVSSTAPKIPPATARSATSTATARSATTTTAPKPRPNSLKPAVPKTATTTKSPSAVKSSSTVMHKATAPTKTMAPSLTNRAPISRSTQPRPTTEKQIKETANKLTASRTTTATRTTTTRKSEEKVSTTKTTATRTISSTASTAATNTAAKRPPIRRPPAASDAKIAATTKVGKPKQNGVAAVVTEQIIVNKTQQGAAELNGLSNGDGRFVKDNSPVDNKLIVESSATTETAAN